MKLTIIGTGYVGLVSGACFSKMGNTVTCVDIDSAKIEQLKLGLIPIYEPGLEDLVRENMRTGTLTFSTSLELAISGSTVVFIAVGTPTLQDGSADLEYVHAVARSIGSCMKNDLLVVNKSTVPVGTANVVRQIIQDELLHRSAGYRVSVASNPEFLKEGSAIDDFMSPDRVVLGVEDDSTFAILKDLYASFTFSHDRILRMDLASAEMTKYAANAMLATKISFMNEIANICELVGADVNKVRVGIGSDQRIGYSFIYPGIGYGGSCFPKDVRALQRTAIDHGYVPRLLQAVEEINIEQKTLLARKIRRRFGDNLFGRTFAIWGLAFKPETDDMREAPSLVLIRELISSGCRVRAYDPRAMREAQEKYIPASDSLAYCESKYDALNGADALILVTEWKEFRSPDFEEVRRSLKSGVVFDGRNQYSAGNLKKFGLECIQIGVRSAKKV